MRTQYISTFITGFEKVIQKSLKQTLEKVEVDLMLDGLVAYTTDSNLDKVKNIKFVNNTFLPIYIFKDPSDSPIKNMTRYVKDKVTFDKTLNGVIYRKYRTFRIITSENNQMVTTDKQPIQKLESKISEITELTPDRSYPDIEFWILSRSEGFGFFGARVTRHPDFTKSLPKGELRPELAHILSLISEPQITDTFLDPFAGYGSIPDARTSYPYEKIIASDNDENLIKKLRLRFENRKNIEIMNLDALKLKELDDQTIDKIVTDPPWGHFLGKELNLEEFYTAMLDSFYRVLKKGGKAVILIGEKELFEKLLKQKEKLFKLIEKFTTLVSGHKAGVYKIQSPKNPQDKEG